MIHTFNSRGIAIDYSREGPVKSDLSYFSALEIISKNMIVTDIHIQRCLRGFSCDGPPARSELTFWEKSLTKLNLFPDDFQLFDYYMYVEKSPTVESDRFVIDITFTLTEQQPESNIKNSKFLKYKISPSGYIWIQYIEVLDFKIPVVREVNVFYGKEDMKDSRKHWEFEPSRIPIPGKFLIHAKISMLKVSVVDEIVILKSEQDFDSILKKNEMLVTTTPKFKIIQLSDMHIGQDTGACYDDCKFDIDTLEFVKSAIQQEGDVQLIVITGDMIDVSRTTHYGSVVLKALSPVLESGIPFIFTFGDSDYRRTGHVNKIEILNFIASLPGCYNKKYDDLDHRLHGLSNGNLKIYNAQSTSEDGQIDLQNLPLKPANALVTYLDSEGKMVKDSQANYVYRVNHKQSSDTEHKLLFLHYPLPNFRPKGTVKLIGSYNEKHELVTETDKKFLEDIKASGYKAVAVGHEHENDACIWEETGGAKVLLCYSGVTGESGLTRLDPGYKRRLRVFEFDFEKNKIYGWKRDQEKSIDPQEIWSGEAAG
ncbi:Metallo-dependent phosphatase [Metschnikowia bicuspidata var. bicuspidata NRRL YB-4993]|uniref:Metallo-dependent phosphatase n=1 Tax=Metschnikowia bicuspidata var. bicuspidata NRRL YB-4993 TaxID=869754 RepID=A0A1A0HCF9_9ASCO|nr:Metallo-dependent phosphatase [Metschnikowia bicuspidata var. bicuspidata NRRL YB-4993]OBA21681.1 Metallo-dependent phosphatase [Metschnikowia bicuspidata var. bicuspidata NRRL YB-4993]